MSSSISIAGKPRKDVVIGTVSTVYGYNLVLFAQFIGFGVMVIDEFL